MQQANELLRHWSKIVPFSVLPNRASTHPRCQRCEEAGVNCRTQWPVTSRASNPWGQSPSGRSLKWMPAVTAKRWRAKPEVTLMLGVVSTYWPISAAIRDRDNGHQTRFSRSPRLDGILGPLLQVAVEFMQPFAISRACCLDQIIVSRFRNFHEPLRLPCCIEQVAPKF